MPKLLEKRKVLGGRAEIIKYEESPDTWYYREKLPEEKAYRTRKISNVVTQLEAEDAAILIYAQLRSEPVIPREERIKRDDLFETEQPSPHLSPNAANHNDGIGGAYLLTDRSKPERSDKFIKRKRKGTDIDKAIDEHLTRLSERVEANELKESTFKEHLQTLAVHLKRYFKKEGITKTSQITADTFTNYPLYRKGCSKLTKNKEARHIKGFVDNYLAKKKLVDVDVVSNKKLVPMVKIRQEDLDANPAINDEDWRKINSWIRNIYLKQGETHPRPSVHYWRYLFWHFTLIMKNSGARPVELLNLRWKDIQIEDVGRISQSKKREEIEELEAEGIEIVGDDFDIDPNAWALNPEALGREERLISHIFIRASKTGKQREIPANLGNAFRRFKEFQERYIEENQLDLSLTPHTLIFGNPHNFYSQYSYATFTSSWHKCMTALDGLLIGHKFSERPYTIYSMRSTFIENGLLSGMDVFLLSRVCGHSVEMLQRHYERIDVKERAEEITKLDYGKKKRQVRTIDLFS